MISAFTDRRINNFNNLYSYMYPHKQARNATLIVTHACDLRCSYCYEHNKSDEKMSLDTAKACIDMLLREDMRESEYINDSVFHGIVLEFIGGEPLLEIELIDQVTDYLRERCIELNHRWATQYMISMTTNGIRYFDPRVQQYLAKNQGRVSMAVTLDGDKETHDSCRVDCKGCGSYEKAAPAFSDVMERYNQYGTKFTIAPANVARVFAACRDMIERFDLRSLHCNCVYEEGWTEELAGVLYQELKRLADWIIESGRQETLMLSIFDSFIGKPLESCETQNWCGGTGKMLAFDVDGTIYPCLRYAPLSIAGRPSLRIGDVEHGIGTLAQDAATVSMLEGITRQSQSSPECLACPIASGCGWCSAYNYEVTGTPNKRVTYICPTHKARCLAASYYHNRAHALKGEAERFPLNVPREWALPIIGAEEYAMLEELAKEENT